MSLDKFVSRGFAGSLGSGEGKWVQTSSTTSLSNQAANQRVGHPGGTSFIMGGGGLGARPAGSKESPRRDSGSPDDRYSFNAHDIRSRGTTRHSQESKNGIQAESLNDWMRTKRGHQVVVGIAMYGIALFILIFLLVSLFGSDSNEGFYSAPAGLSRHARPMWER
jgi:hypothetical protein